MTSRPVDLHVYDLSNGMAAQFSESVLGKRIELVPHTGVLVFGLECVPPRTLLPPRRRPSN